MAVAFDAVGSKAGDGSSFTFSHTCTGTDLVLIVGVSLLGSVGRTVTGITYNGVALTSIGNAANATTYRVEFWQLIAPATGTHNVVVSTGGPPDSVSIGSLSFTGAHQTTPVSGFTSATGNSANPAVTVTSTTNSMVATVCIDAGSTSLTCDKTIRWNAVLGTDTPRGGGATAAGASSVTTTFTGSNNLWAILGISIDPSSSNVTTTQTITGTARIQATTTKTITGTARIQGTTTKTITGLSRITNTSAQTINGVARIQATTTRTINGTARIQGTTTQTIQGTSRIQVSTTRNITGVASIASATVTTTQTISGVARIQGTVAQTISGTSRIQKSTTKTITGVANIATTSTQTIPGTSRIQVTTIQTIQGVANIQNTVTQTITGVASIVSGNTTVKQVITGVSSIVKTATQTITGVANIRNTTTKNITGVARILNTINDNLFAPNDGGSTRLSEYITASSTSLIVASTDGFAASGILLIANNEIITYTSLTSRSFDGLTRGAYNSLARAWPIGSRITELQITALKTDVTTDIYANPTVQYKNEGISIESKGAIQYIDYVGSGINAVATGGDTITVTVNGYTVPTFVTLAGDVVNNDASADTMADVTGLSFAVTAGNTYSFEFIIPYTAAATTTGSRWSINGPAATLLAYRSEYTLDATTQTTNSASAYDMPAASNASSLTSGNIATIIGIITPSADGTVIARFASEVSGSAITAKTGATCQWLQVL